MIMAKLQNNFTTSEQSKRLLELGILADSADCVYTTWKYDTPSITYLFDDKFSSLVNDPDIQADIKEGFINITPCWSVGRLNEIFKICSDNHIEIYDLDLEGTQIERAMQAFENYAKYNWLDFSKLEE